MRIVDNKAVLLTVKHPQQVTTIIPDSKQISANEVLVRWRLDEMQVLQNLGVQTVSPIVRKYQWTGRFPPYAHQKETAAFLTLNKRAYVFSQQGTGKTGSCIWAADYLLRTEKIRRVLVVCPVSIMDCAWRADLFSIAMHRKVDIAHGSAEKRRKVIASDAEFVIINYDGVKVVHKELKAGGFDLIIVDEGNFVKNANSGRWKALNALVRPETWVWLLTGTPAAQSPVDAYGLAKLVTPHRAPRTFTTFQDQVMIKVSKFRWAPKKEAPAIVHRTLQPAIRHTKAECLDLPPVTIVRRKVELSKQQKHYYDRLRAMNRLPLEGTTITAVNAAVVMNKLLQISSGAVYTDEEGVTAEFDIGPRYNVLREVIDESDNKLLLFVQYRNTITRVLEALAADGVPAAAIHGAIPVAKRTELFHQFQTEATPKVLVIQPQAAAHGVTLTAADTVVWWSPTPSLEIYDQANARIDRPGQRNPMTVVQLYGSYIERYVYSLLDSKIDILTKIVTLYKEVVDHDI